ncbi:MAG: nickel pincer cofactor biosynthesis protein LarB [Oscillospiraceae bacterium]|jgi:NCAIR mutase (PurE)-related protein|nr:nickel pincer cofactor biosynthesis protein LarB [Oscillospiraceae bacterium]
MEQDRILTLLNSVKSGGTSPEEALLRLKALPFEDVGFAKIDHHRELRHGIGEVIYGEGKTAEQIVRIVSAMVGNGRKNIMITRLTPEKAAEIEKAHQIDYEPASRIGVCMREREETPRGLIVVAAAGTSDIPVAEEAAFTAETLGNKVERLYDVGVAGLHRLLNYLDVLMTARAIVAVAGMEGALATVVGGLVSCPVIAAPTSVGYGANFGGISALLTMLNSCAGNVSVVNIDNGFAAGYIASLINR